jgi:hypothetical protein
MSGLILICNAGSHNTKLAALDAETLEPIGNHKAQSNEEAQAWLASIGAHGTVIAIGPPCCTWWAGFYPAEAYNAATVGQAEKPYLLGTIASACGHKVD